MPTHKSAGVHGACDGTLTEPTRKQETSVLPQPIEICIKSTTKLLKGKCLGYIDPATSTWTCQVCSCDPLESERARERERERESDRVLLPSPTLPLLLLLAAGSMLAQECRWLALWHDAAFDIVRHSAVGRQSRRLPGLVHAQLHHRVNWR